MYFFFFKQKTAYEMRISDWSSDVCSSDLRIAGRLDHEHVLAADIFVNFHENLFVGEAADARVGQGNLDIVGDGGRERLVGIAGHELHGQTPKSKWRDILMTLSERGPFSGGGPS